MNRTRNVLPWNFAAVCWCRVIIRMTRHCISTLDSMSIIPGLFFSGP
ncbi:unnamed protein product [Gongylonema pulchrum]|uniref:Uncharacterized protein n=1 Tax=Gongylonema pulchrum TaxID=637853 RepID=A0A183DCY6_9BILA|nr:unnamed protein product [Gongylonema pulchrum]